jgi:hypothetical protein
MANLPLAVKLKTMVVKEFARKFAVLGVLF